MNMFGTPGPVQKKFFGVDQTALIEFKDVTQDKNGHVSITLTDDGSLPLIKTSGIRISKLSHEKKLELKLACTFKEAKEADVVMKARNTLNTHDKHSAGDDTVIFSLTGLEKNAISDILKLVQLNEQQQREVLNYIFPAPLPPKRPSADQVRRLSESVNQLHSARRASLPLNAGSLFTPNLLNAIPPPPLPSRTVTDGQSNPLPSVDAPSASAPTTRKTGPT
jgi:hypothetical protein